MLKLKGATIASLLLLAQLASSQLLGSALISNASANATVSASEIKNKTRKHVWTPFNPFPPPPECDLRVWVRSEDLRPSTVVEGDVRLFNNLTARSAEECQVASWSLGLRLKERAAIQYMTGRPTRPHPPPGLNLTAQADEEEEELPFESDQMVFGRIKETVKDEGHELRKKWDLALESWVEKVKEWEESKAYQAIDNETTVFESFLDMGRPKNTRLDGTPNQHQVENFAIAIPATNFGAREDQDHMSYSGFGIEVKSESDFSYFASIKLANGSTIEVYAGAANFLPVSETEVGLVHSREGKPVSPGSAVGLSLEKECIEPWLDDEYEDDDDDEETTSKCLEPVKEWKVELALPADGHWVQGLNYTINGKLIAPQLSSDVPATLEISLHSDSHSHWAIETLTRKEHEDGSLDVDMFNNYSGIHPNSSEVLEKAIKVIKQQSYASLQREGPAQLETLLSKGRNKKKDPDNNDRWMRGGRSSRNSLDGTYRSHSFEEEATSQLQAASAPVSYDFQVHLSVPNNTFPSSRSSIQTISSSLKFRLKTVDAASLSCLHLEVLKEKRIKPKPEEVLKCESTQEAHSEFNHELSDWVPDDHKLKDATTLWNKVFNEEGRRSCYYYDECSNPTLQNSHHHETVKVAIVPRIWKEPKRSKELEEKLSKAGLIGNKQYPPFHYSEEISYARAPVFVVGSREELLRAVDLVLEESQHHRSIRSSNSSTSDLIHLDASFPTIANLSVSNVNTHWSGLEKYRRSEVKRRIQKKLGEEHLIHDEKKDDGDDDDYYDDPKRYSISRNQLREPSIYDFPSRKGSGALDIGLIWNENVMLDIIRERNQGQD